MSGFPIFIVRLILGMAFGILLTRIFRPEWSIFQGIALGGGLVAGAYLMQLMRQRNSKK
ncbi:hypothetical protein SAMN02746065_1094 [Desulfocicer vacuolatum DSM 3385]|uniref:Uncharacterized protein n=1 Tax=Desulfocicer vacuolatum DSM 3385 TaxID=1121400 RepID=A0A1W2BNL7_9BACT|nr:hypothetical protein [Desulfocicer vacuolatum]SMC74471.1 hypothetical protein SAMN02746065_1094 [Desulfocicer vacuolatum DSM 3385]